MRRINGARRRIMHGLTRNMSNPSLAANVSTNGPVKIEKILICRPNHRLGNLLLITPLVQEIIFTFPACKIDVLVKGGIGPIVFKNYKNINAIIALPKKPFTNLASYLQGWIDIRKNHYDIVFNVVNDSSSGRLSAQFANSTFKFVSDDNIDAQLKVRDYEHIARSPVQSFRKFIETLGFKQGDTEIPSLDIKLDNAELAAGQQVLRKLVVNSRKTICIYTFATGEKCYSEVWWGEFYEKLKAACPDYNIIEILPIENVSMIGFKAPAFYSKDIREIASVIAGSSLFIGADSGIMHLASAARAATVGLFSITNPNAYGPYGNKSIGIDTSKTDIDGCLAIVQDILLQ
ncbi:MAG: glycosyltransferase family 9 protein [Chryseolinea sp.]